MKTQSKGKPKKARPAKVVQEYLQVFTAYPLPYQGIYTDEDSLEQPSQLRYVPSTTTPSVS